MSYYFNFAQLYFRNGFGSKKFFIVEKSYLQMILVSQLVLVLFSAFVQRFVLSQREVNYTIMPQSFDRKFLDISNFFHVFRSLVKS